MLEILDGAPPQLVERMRLPLAIPHVLIELDRRPDGDLDVVLGPEPAMIGMEGTTPPGPIRHTASFAFRPPPFPERAKK